jgi:ABC-type multidrug transport system fused ATPase/permease subunit
MNITSRLIKLLFYLTEHFKKLSVWIVLIGTLLSLSEWYIIYRSSVLIEKFEQKGRVITEKNFDLQSLQLEIIILLLLFIFSIIANRIYMKSSVKIGENFISHFTFQLANRAPFDGPSETDKKYVEIILQKALRVSEGVIIPLLTIFPRIILMLLLIVFIFIQLGWTACYGLVAIFTFYITLILVQRVGVIDRSKIQKQKKQRKFEIIQAIFSSRREYTVSGQSTLLLKRFEEIDNTYSDARGENQFRGILPRIIIENSIPLILIGITIIIAFFEVESGLFAFSAAALLRFIPASQQIYSSINSILNDWSSLESVQNQNELIDILPINADSKFKNKTKNQNSISVSIPIKHQAGTKYNITQGEICFLIGPSGSGKSTLIDAILGFRNYGSFKVSKPSNLRVSIIEQSADRILFGEELRLGKVQDILVKDYISKFALRNIVSIDKENLEYFVPEKRLLNVSGGEWQRLNLLAKLSENADFIILDEAINAVSEEDQYRLLRYIKRVVASQNSYCLIVSHLNKAALSEISKNMISL